DTGREALPLCDIGVSSALSLPGGPKHGPRGRGVDADGEPPSGRVAGRASPPRRSCCSVGGAVVLSLLGGFKDAGVSAPGRGVWPPCHCSSVIASFAEFGLRGGLDGLHSCSPL